MSFVMSLGAVALVILIACIVAHVHTTNNIIKTQEKQIARLTTEKIRLEAALQKASHKEATQVIEIHDNTIDPENVPSYKPF